MEQITPDRVTHAQIDSGVIKCKCGNELFQNIFINTYRDMPTDLFSKVKAYNADAISILECVKCSRRQLPPILYQGMARKDIAIMKHVHAVLEEWNSKHETPTA